MDQLPDSFSPGPRQNEPSQDNTQAGEAADNAPSIASDFLGAMGLGRKNKPRQAELESSGAAPSVAEEQTDKADTGMTSAESAPPENKESDKIVLPGFSLIRDGPTVKTKRRLWLFIGPLLLLALALALTRSLWLPWLTEPKPPAPDVVATYGDQAITAEALKSFVLTEGAKEREHMLCPAHGYDHSKCDPSEECEAHPVDSIEGYQEALTRMAVEKMVTDWAEAKGITQRDNVQHSMNDLLNDASVNQYLQQLYDENVSPDSVDRWEVQQYYSQNMDSFQGKTLAEAENEIRQTLAYQKESTFFSDYVEELKKTAGLQVDYEVLRVDDPTSKEIEAYYEANPSLFTTENAAAQGETAETQSVAPLSQVRDKINALLLLEKMAQSYPARKDEMLFSVHSRRYTLGEFYQEFLELSGDYQSAFSSFEAKQALVEQIIIQEMLLEKTDDAASKGQEGHQMEELKVQYLSQILHQDEVDQNLTQPTEEEIQAFYQQNPTYFTTSEGAELSLIWISQGNEGEKKEQALQKAGEAASQLQRGVAFETVAQSYSEDTSAQAGGLLNGVIHLDELPDVIATALAKMDVGQVSDVIDYSDGYYILLLRSKTASELSPLEDVREWITTLLQSARHEEMTAQMEDQLLKDVAFTIYPSSLRRMIDQRNAGEAR